MEDINKDIKDLYKYISFSKKSENFSHDTDWKWNKELGEKIEHLIQAYKELEEENEICKEELEKIDKVLNLEAGRAAPYRYEIIESLQRGITQLKKIIDNSIPVSLVEETIEELNRKIKYEENEKVIIWLYKQRKILQELLEE